MGYSRLLKVVSSMHSVQWVILSSTDPYKSLFPVMKLVTTQPPSVHCSFMNACSRDDDSIRLCLVTTVENLPAVVSGGEHVILKS